MNVAVSPPDLSSLDALAAKIRDGLAADKKDRSAWVERVLQRAKCLAEARRQFPSNSAFSQWLADEKIDIGPNDRAALIAAAAHPELTRKVLMETQSRSIELIWRREVQPQIEPQGEPESESETKPHLTKIVRRKPDEAIDEANAKLERVRQDLRWLAATPNLAGSLAAIMKSGDLEVVLALKDAVDLSLAEADGMLSVCLAKSKTVAARTPKATLAAVDFAPWYDAPLPPGNVEIGSAHFEFADGTEVSCHAVKSKKWHIGQASRAACDHWRYRKARELGIEYCDIDSIAVPAITRASIGHEFFDPIIVNENTRAYRRPAANRFANIHHEQGVTA